MSQCRFHHSSFRGGAPVAAAGYTRIADELTKDIKPKSGHSWPTNEHPHPFVATLAHQGMREGFMIDADIR